MKRNDDAQRVLELYRRELAPSSETRARMLRRLLDEPAGADLGQPHPDPGGSGAATAAISGARLVLAGASAATVLLLAAGWWAMQRGEPPRPPRDPGAWTAASQSAEAVTEAVAKGRAPHAAASEAPPASAPSSDAPVRDGASVAPPRALPAAARVRPAARAAERAAASPQAHPPSPPDAPTPASEHDDQLEQELRLMRAAHDALRRHEPRRALQRLAEHAARFPGGELAAARRVARIMALCMQGRVALARSEAASFVQRFAASPYAARVRGLCTQPPAEP